MRVRLISKNTIEKYVKAHSNSRASFEIWLSKVKGADWKSPEDIMETFPSADLLGDGTEKVIFEIGGNNYRIICKYWFSRDDVHLYVKWIGTHAEYDKL